MHENSREYKYLSYNNGKKFSELFYWRLTIDIHKTWLICEIRNKLLVFYNSLVTLSLRFTLYVVARS